MNKKSLTIIWLLVKVNFILHVSLIMILSLEYDYHRAIESNLIVMVMKSPYNTDNVTLREMAKPSYHSTDNWWLTDSTQKNVTRPGILTDTYETRVLERISQ